MQMYSFFNLSKDAAVFFCRAYIIIKGKVLSMQIFPGTFRLTHMYTQVFAAGSTLDVGTQNRFLNFLSKSLFSGLN